MMNETMKKKCISITCNIDMYTSKIFYLSNCNELNYHCVSNNGSINQWHNEDSALEWYNTFYISWIVINLLTILFVEMVWTIYETMTIPTLKFTSDEIKTNEKM